MQPKLLCLAVAYSVAAQQQDPSFAAVSIRPSSGQPRYGKIEFQPGGRFQASNASMRQLINAAYGLTGRARVAKGPNCPSWFDSDRFDIQAVAEEGGGDARRMLQTVLAERFKLAVRREPKEMRAYILSVDASGARLMKSPLSDADCQKEPAKCHSFSGNSFQGGIRGDAVTMADLAFRIETVADWPVIDSTGLTGTYSMRIRPFKTLRAYLNDFPGSERAPAEPDASIFEVLEKDFGLRLRDGRAKVEQLVVESIERPSAN
jgi:uncharacterized protein (TIGR03435 family)